MPMIIIDSPSVIKNRLMFSARGAGILGFSIFGADKIYALDDEMKIDFGAIEAFWKSIRMKKFCCLVLPLWYGSIFIKNSCFLKSG